jgi:membrane protein implicated in regulation of membrane protease activity
VATLFLICAAFGGTILVLQAVMTLVGLGGDALHTDVGSDMGHDFGGDVHADTGGGFHGDAGTHVDAGSAGAHGSTDGTHAVQDQHHAAQDQGSSKLFAVLSFRGIVAAMAFFGISGMTAQAADLPPPTVLLIAIACGVAAIYVVYWLMQTLSSLQAEGTVRIDRAVGEPATVYLRIPERRSGAGKIQINLQNRTMEYEAVTEGDSLPTGARVTVVGVVNPETVEVRPLASTGEVSHE